MGLVIIIAIGIFIWWLFCKEGLINAIKPKIKHNKEIRRKIKNNEPKIQYKQYFFNGSYELVTENYTKKDFQKYSDNIQDFILVNMLLNIVNFICVLMLSQFIVCFLPKQETSYEFKINSLKDNMTTEGYLYGRRGYINDELSYFFSRSYTDGEKIGHIPADKTYVKYNNEEHPHITVYQESSIVNKFVDKMTFAGVFDTTQTVKYIITVPDGTIETTGTYSIDME